MEIQFTYEMCNQGRHWIAFMECDKQGKQWLCSFEHNSAHDGLAKCREFAARTKENILLYSQKAIVFSNGNVTIKRTPIIVK